MNKKGQGGLSMNTIIVAIIGIIVLLLIVTFFTGGMSTVFGKIRGVFSGGTAGYDVDLARVNCESLCERAQRISTGNVASTNAQKVASAYCKTTFDVPDPSSGNIAAKRCFNSPISVTCSGVQTISGCTS